MATIDDYDGLMVELSKLFPDQFKHARYRYTNQGDWRVFIGTPVDQLSLIGVLIFCIEESGFGYELSTIYTPSSGDVAAQSGPCATVCAFDSDGYESHRYFAVGSQPALALGLALLRAHGIQSYDNGENLPF